MFKLTVAQILASIETLTYEEKQELHKQLPSVFKEPNTPAQKDSQAAQQSMKNTLGDITIRGRSSSLNFQPSQAINNFNATDNLPADSEDYKSLLESLLVLQKTVKNSESLPALSKAGAESQVSHIVNEIQKDKPDKGLISKTVSILKQGLQGFKELAEPIATVASLVAKIWGVPLP